VNRYIGKPIQRFNRLTIQRIHRAQQDNWKTIEEKEIQAARHPAMAQFESAWAELSPARFRAKSGGTACTPSP